MYKYMYIFRDLESETWVRQRVSGLKRCWILLEKGKRWWRLVAIPTFTSFVMLGEKGDRPTEQSSSLFPSGQLKLNSFIRYCEWLEESGTCCSRPILKLEICWSKSYFWWTSEARNNPMWANFCMQNWRWPPAPRVWIQNVPVCTLKTSPCVPAPRAHVELHLRVVPAYTVMFWMYTRRRFWIHTLVFPRFFQRAATHTNKHTKHIILHAERETERDRERRQRKRDESRRDNKEKKREDERGETREEKREERRH